MRFRGVSGLGVGVRAVAAASALLLLAQCRKESMAPAYYVPANTTLAANATVASAVVGTPFSFPGGAGVFAPALAGQSMTVTFGGTDAALTTSIAISNASGAATGTITTNTTFGSCIFVVTGVTGSTGGLTVGSTITVNPCNFNVGTAGAQANGTATSRSVALLLGAASSAGATVTVGVNNGGQLTLNGKTVGTVTLAPVTGDDD